MARLLLTAALFGLAASAASETEHTLTITNAAAAELEVYFVDPTTSARVAQSVGPVLAGQQLRLATFEGHSFAIVPLAPAGVALPDGHELTETVWVHGDKSARLVARSTAAGDVVVAVHARSSPTPGGRKHHRKLARSLFDPDADDAQRAEAVAALEEHGARGHGDSAAMGTLGRLVLHARAAASPGAALDPWLKASAHAAMRAAAIPASGSSWLAHLTLGLWQHGRLPGFYDHPPNCAEAVENLAQVLASEAAGGDPLSHAVDSPPALLLDGWLLPPPPPDAVDPAGGDRFLEYFAARAGDAPPELAGGAAAAAAAPADAPAAGLGLGGALQQMFRARMFGNGGGTGLGDVGVEVGQFEDSVGEANYALGEAHQYGLPQASVKPNATRARAYYARAAAEGVADAHVSLALMDLNNEGLADAALADGGPADKYETAKAHLEASGTAAGLHVLGYLALHGLGGPANATLAAELYGDASAAGYSDADVSLALMYLSGVDDVAADHGLALELLKGAAGPDSHGSLTAKYNLALMHLNGWGLEDGPNCTAAADLMASAAQQAWADEQHGWGLELSAQWYEDDGLHDAALFAYEMFAFSGSVAAQLNAAFILERQADGAHAAAAATATTTGASSRVPLLKRAEGYYRFAEAAASPEATRALGDCAAAGWEGACAKDADKARAHWEAAAAAGNAQAAWQASLAALHQGDLPRAAAIAAECSEAWPWPDGTPCELLRLALWAPASAVEFWRWLAGGAEGWALSLIAAAVLGVVMAYPVLPGQRAAAAAAAVPEDGAVAGGDAQALN